MRRGLNTAIVVVVLASVLGLCSCGSKKDAGKTGSVPAAPSGVEVKLVDAGLHVSWEPVPGAVGYIVFWGLEKGNYRGLRNSKDSSLVVTGLPKGELYDIAVTAWNQKGESDYSKEQVVVYDDQPSNAKRHLARGNELIRLGSLKDSFAYLNAAIRLESDNAEAFKSRGMVFEKMNLPELARKDYAMADQITRKKRISLRP